jgi:release factor glutamine methyltransferase
MQLRAALQAGLKTLLDAHVPSAGLAAELLLMHVARCDRSYLYTHPEAELPTEAADHYRELIAERATGKPTQYIIGHQEFWGLDFEVTPDVLIPRPETEHVVEAVLDLATRLDTGRESPLHIVDVGTGSGCIVLALASELPAAKFLATDISRAALAVARRNAQRLHLAGRVQFVEADLLSCFLQNDFPGAFDFVVSNPPYVANDEINMVQREVRDFEPRLAWGGLERGDEIYRRLFAQAPQVLKPQGWVVVEIGYNKRDVVVALLDSGWTNVEVRPDLAGIPRVVTACKSTP